MGFLSFRRGRKSPSPLSIPNCTSASSQTMWNSNRAILQGSDLPDYEDVESLSHTWDSSAFDSFSPLYSFNPPNRSDSLESNKPLEISANLETVPDFWNTSIDISSLMSSFFDSFHTSDRPATASSIYGDALEELADFPIEQSLFSPTSVYNDETHPENDLVLYEQYPFSPSSPVGSHPFSSDFTWPPQASDIHVRLQSPPEFNYSWIRRDLGIVTFTIISCPRITSMYGVPDPAPTIFDWTAFGYNPSGAIIYYGPYPRTLIFGSCIRGRLSFTFAHDEPPFPPEGCLCRFNIRCNMHPLGLFSKRQLIFR
jgi:hypothetical protein